MRVLVLTTLYPTPAAPHRAGFMPGRLAALAAYADVTLIAPRQSYPFVGLAGRSACGEESDPPFPIHRPRFYALPGIGRNRRAAAIYRAVVKLATGLHAAHGFDVILGHFLYPDGVAAARLAARLDLPVVLVAHGSDVYQHAEVPARRRQIASALASSAALIVVSRALRDRLRELGLPSDEAAIIPCGYDAERFAPRPRDAARRELHLADATWLLYVGALRDLKRVDVILEALGRLPDLRLAVVGDGPEAPRLGDAARRLGVERRVVWAGPQSHERVPLWMAAADAVVLASEHEGTPTVLVEAMAMGRPVVATAVGGIPELVGPLARLVRSGDGAALADAIAETLADPPPAETLRERVAGYAWPRLGEAEAAVLRRAIG